MSPSESAGPFAAGDAFERLGVLETLSYGVVREGKVFRASQAEPLTLLELDRAFQRDLDVLESLLIAVAAAAPLSDSAIVASHGAWRDGDSLYLLAEALPGMSLARAFEALAIAGARLSTEAVLRVTGGILAALDHLGKQIPGSEDAPYGHGFLTPENVFLAEGQRVLVRGIGIWPAVALTGLVGPAQSRYLAPAQLRAGVASPRSDLFSLATILFELVCGIPAFDGPPDDDGVASLQEAIEERKKEAEFSLLPLYGAMVSCLAPGPAVSTFRSRLRTTVDTLFLEEFPRERAAKSLTLADLLERVKPRRPAVVKARPLNLTRVGAVWLPIIVAAPATKAKRPAVFEPAQRPSPADRPEVAAAAGPLRPFAAAVQAVRGRPLLRALALGAAAVAAVVLALSSRPRSWPKPAPETRPEAAAIASYVETPRTAAASATPDSAAPLSTSGHPADDPVGAAGATSAESTASRRQRARPSGRAVRRSEAADVDARSSSPEEAGGDAAAPPGAGAPSVAAGSLVALGTPGLVRPVVSEAPETLRYGAGDARPPVTRTALLEVLVDENGRVAGIRILRVQSPPPGFSTGVERYLAALRFRPARVGEVPVSVWMPYELKYLAP